MKQIKRVFTALCLTAAPVVTGVASASAVPASATTVIQGTYQATAPTCTHTDASGRWSFTLREDGTAIVSQTVFLDGQLHAVFGGSAFNRYPGCDAHVLGGVTRP